MEESEQDIFVLPKGVQFVWKLTGRDHVDALSSRNVNCYFRFAHSFLSKLNLVVYGLYQNSIPSVNSFTGVGLDLNALIVPKSNHIAVFLVGDGQLPYTIPL